MSDDENIYNDVNINVELLEMHIILDERLKSLYIKNNLVSCVVNRSLIEGISEKEMLIRLILILAESNEKLSDTMLKIHETGIIQI